MAVEAFHDTRLGDAAWAEEADGGGDRDPASLMITTPKVGTGAVWAEET